MATKEADFDIFEKSNSELHKIAKEHDIKYATTMRKSELIFKIKESAAAQEGLSFVEGCLEILDGNFADMRKGQIFPTNMIYNEKNIKLIEKFMRNTEVYEGDYKQ